MAVSSVSISDCDRIDRLTSPEPNSGCWLWLGNLSDYGYARMWFGTPRKLRKVHLVNFERFNGPIPVGMVLRHRCDTRPCINPAHLLPGTQAENVADMVARGRQRPGGKRGELHHKSVLTEQKVRDIRYMYGNGGHSYGSLSRQFRVCVSTISRIIRRQYWDHLTDE